MSSSSAVAGERVPLGTLLAYSPPVFALSSLLFTVQFFFLKYATDELLLSPTWVGVVFALGRIWDAISDPIVGTWSDRTRWALGRRRPWMWAAVMPLMLSFAFLWQPPAALGDAGKLVWVTAGLLAFYTAYTMYAVPHQSLGAELSRGYHERSRIFAFNAVFFTGGMIAAFAAIEAVNNAVDRRAAMTGVTIAAGIGVLAILPIPPLRLRERAEYLGRGADRPLRALKDVVANPHARLLLAVQFIQLLGASVLGILSPFVFEYVLKRPDMLAVLPAAFVLCSVASVPVWLVVSRRIGKRLAWAIAQVGFALPFGALFFVGEGQIAWVGVMLVLAGIASGCGGAIGPSVLADVIDWDELQSGERKEGAYSAAWGFAIKSSNAVVILLTGVGLDVFGFVPNQEQSDAALLGLRVLYSLLPFVAYLVGALLLLRFRLDEAEHARIRKALDARGAL